MWHCCQPVQNSIGILWCIPSLSPSHFLYFAIVTPHIVQSHVHCFQCWEKATWRPAWFQPAILLCQRLCYEPALHSLKKDWLYLVTFSKFQLCFSSQWRVLFLKVHNKWHLPCLSSLLASALNSYGQERKLTWQLLLKEAQSCGGDWLMIQIEGAEGFGISLTAVLSRCCCLFLVLMWPEALGVGEYKRELQFSTESRVAVTWHCLIPSYSAARLSWGYSSRI